jgi:hypothetical protein
MRSRSRRALPRSWNHVGIPLLAQTLLPAVRSLPMPNLLQRIKPRTAHVFHRIDPASPGPVVESCPG